MKRESELKWLNQVSRDELAAIIVDTADGTIEDVETILNTGKDFVQSLTALVSVALDVADRLQQQRQPEGTPRSLFRPSSNSRIIDNPFECQDIVRDILDRIKDFPRVCKKNAGI